MKSEENNLSDLTRKNYRLYAYASTWFGCIAEVMPEGSAILILYFSLLGAGSNLTMFAMGMSGLASLFLLIPASGLVDRIGIKKSVNLSCCMGVFANLLMAIAPFFGSTYDEYIVLVCYLIFCISRPIWTAAWYPILGFILRPAERADFFGFMRFSYYTLSGALFFLIGVCMGKHPPIWLLQIIIAIIGILALGRMHYISKIKMPEPRRKNSDIKKAFSISIRNAPLVGFSIYICFLALAFSSVIPLTMIYLKNGLHFGANVVQILSSIGIGGCILGFFFYGRLAKKIGTLSLQIMIHVAYIVIPLCLFLCHPSAFWLGALLFAANFFFACFGCMVSSEILALARPGNLTMANAFTQTYQMIGTASGRFVVSLLLGHGILSSSWQCWNISVSHFQTIFLFCSGIAFFSLILLFCLPSVVPRHEDYYNP